MKKIVSFLVLVAFALVLVGCGKGDVLTCTGDNQTYKITFSGDKVTKISVTSEASSVEEAKSYEALAKAFYNGDGMKVSRSGKKLTLTMSGAALEEEGTFKGTKEEVKKAAEEDGYKCK